MKALSSVLLALSLLVAPHLSNAQGGTSHKDLEWVLWNNCEPIILTVNVDNNLVKKGLSEKQIENAIVTRLISARIYGKPKENAGELEVKLNSLDHSHSYSILVSFKLLAYRLLYSDQWTSGTTITWVISGHGISSQPRIILDAVTETIDEFVADYLRINYPAC